MIQSFEEKIYDTLELILTSNKCEKSDRYRVNEIINETLEKHFSKKFEDLSPKYINLKSLNV